MPILLKCQILGCFRLHLQQNAMVSFKELCGLTPAANMKQCILTVSSWLLNSERSLRVIVDLSESYPTMEAQGAVPELLRKVLMAYDTVSLHAIYCRWHAYRLSRQPHHLDTSSIRSIYLLHGTVNMPKYISKNLLCFYSLRNNDYFCTLVERPLMKFQLLAIIFHVGFCGEL